MLKLSLIDLFDRLFFKGKFRVKPCKRGRERGSEVHVLMVGRTRTLADSCLTNDLDVDGWGRPKRTCIAHFFWTLSNLRRITSTVFFASVKKVL